MSPASARALPATFPVAAVRDRWLFALAFAALAASFLLWSREDDALKASILAVGSAHPALDPLWRGASDLARGPGLVAAVFAISMAVHAPERRQLVLSSALLGGLLCQALKLLAHRARPLQDDLMLSWPSGHATSAFCAALALTLGARCSTKREAYNTQTT